jgi:hypothetical protein
MSVAKKLKDLKKYLKSIRIRNSNKNFKSLKQEILKIRSKKKYEKVEEKLDEVIDELSLAEYSILTRLLIIQKP